MKKVMLGIIGFLFFAIGHAQTLAIKEKFIVKTEWRGLMTFGTDGRYFYVLNCLSGQYELVMCGKELTKGLQPIAVAEAGSSEEYQEGPARFVMLIFKDKEDKIHPAYYDYLYHAVSFAENEFE